jgi:hypothetical protein
MSHLLRPFAGEWFLKAIAVDTIGNMDISLQFPVSNLPTSPPAATTPLEQLMERRRDPLADTNGWYHGGINE